MHYLLSLYRASIGRETFKNKLIEVIHGEKLPIFDHLFSVYGIYLFVIII